MSLIQKRSKKCQTTAKFIEFRIGKNGTNRADRRVMGTTTAYHETARIELADKYGQTHSGIIRYALKQLALKEN